MEELRFASLALQFGSGFGADFYVAINHCHRSVPLNKFLCAGPPDARAAARYNRNLSLEVHDYNFSFGASRLDDGRIISLLKLDLARTFRDPGQSATAGAGTGRWTL